MIIPVAALFVIGASVVLLAVLQVLALAWTVDMANTMRGLHEHFTRPRPARPAEVAATIETEEEAAA